MIKIAKQKFDNTLYFKFLLLNVATAAFLSLKQKAGFANGLVRLDILRIKYLATKFVVGAGKNDVNFFLFNSF